MKKILGIAIILFSIVLSSLFIHFLITEDLKYKVTQNRDSNSEFLNYDVAIIDTRELYDLDDIQINVLMFLSLGLSVLNIAYALITFKKKGKPSEMKILDYENEILRKQIENNELKQKLKNISLKDANTKDLVEDVTNNNPLVAQISHAEIEGDRAEEIECAKCKSLIASTYTFCPKCGNPVTDESHTKLASNYKIPLSAISVEKYSSGIITTIVWSITLSLLTIGVYALRGLINVDKVVNNLAQGMLARPLIAFLIAYLFSFFITPKPKRVSRFNSVCTYIMGSLSAAEFFRWLAIGRV